MRRRRSLAPTAAALLALAPGLLTAAPAPAPPPKGPVLPLESFTLPNGLKVALLRDAGVPRVTVAVAYHVGSKNEKAGRTGFAHFFEHMMFRGTKNVPNYDIPLEEAGAQSNAFTTEDMTVYHETVPANFLERALYLEAERLGFLLQALGQEKFDTEREVVKNERRQSYENRPYGLDEEAILANVFPKGHPYSWSVIGSMDDLNRATLDDLKQFFNEFYHAGNATLVLVGDFDPAEAKALVSKYFGPLPGGPKPKPVAPAAVAAKGAAVTQYDRVKLPRVYWNWPTVPDDHPDAPALDVLAGLLGGGETSRLHRVLVRDRRLSKDVSASSDTREAAGVFTLQSTAAAGDDPAKALAAIEGAFAEAVAGLKGASPPTDAELARELARHEMNSYESLTQPFGRAVTVAIGFAQKDDPEYYRKEFARYFAVTPADLKRVAETYLTPDKVVVRTLPVGPGHDKSEATKAGPLAGGGEPAAAAAREVGPGPDWSKMPAAAAPKAFQPPRFTRRTLANGLDVWVARWTTLPLVDVRLSIPTGTADDPPGQGGLARLTARMLDQGTKTRTATELAEAFELLGTSLAVRAGGDQVSVGTAVLARNLDPALKLVGEVLTSPRFDPSDFDRERSLHLAALAQGPDSVNWIAARALPVLLYGEGHPYGHPADGDPAGVAALTLADVTKFHAAHFGPKGASLVVVGDVEPDAVFASVGSALGPWRPQGTPPSARPEAKPSAETGVVYLIDKPGAVQSVLSVGRRWYDRSHPSYFAALLGNRILGGDFLSRLNQNLREKNGFTYGAGSAFRFRRNGSVWTVSTQVRTDATAPALKEALGELDALAGGKPFTAEEIATATDAVSRTFPEEFDSPGSIAGVLEEMAEFGLPPDYLDTYLDRLQATKPDAIAGIMKEVIAPKERVILVVGDRKVVEPKLKSLGFTTIKLTDFDGKPAKGE